MCTVQLKSASRFGERMCASACNLYYFYFFVLFSFFFQLYRNILGREDLVYERYGPMYVLVYLRERDVPVPRGEVGCGAEQGESDQSNGRRDR